VTYFSVWLVILVSVDARFEPAAGFFFDGQADRRFLRGDERSEGYLSAVIMVAKPLHDRAAAAPEGKTANVSDAKPIKTNYSAISLSASSQRVGRKRRAPTEPCPSLPGYAVWLGRTQGSARVALGLHHTNGTGGNKWQNT
jgi:hypothetical protein